MFQHSESRKLYDFFLAYNASIIAVKNVKP